MAFLPSLCWTTCPQAASLFSVKKAVLEWTNASRYSQSLWCETHPEFWSWVSLDHTLKLFFFLWSTVIFFFFRGRLLVQSWLYSIDIASHGKFLGVANSVSSFQRCLECAILQTDPKSQSFLDNSILTAHYAISDTTGSESYVLHVIRSPIIR